MQEVWNSILTIINSHNEQDSDSDAITNVPVRCLLPEGSVRTMMGKNEAHREATTIISELRSYSVVDRRERCTVAWPHAIFEQASAINEENMDEENKKGFYVGFLCSEF